MISDAKCTLGKECPLSSEKGRDDDMVIQLWHVSNPYGIVVMLPTKVDWKGERRWTEVPSVLSLMAQFVCIIAVNVVMMWRHNEKGVTSSIQKEKEKRTWSNIAEASMF